MHFGLFQWFVLLPISMTKKIEISHKTIIFTVSFLIFIWFLYYIRDIILIFFISLLIMTILNPTVSRFSRYKIPRAVSVVVVYLLAIGILALAIAGIAPALIEQTTNFANNLPKYLANIGFPSLVSEQVVKEVMAQIGTLPGKILKVGMSIFSNILAVVTVLIIAFYLLLAREKIDEQLANFLGEEKAKEVAKLIDTLEFKLGGWARGQLALMIVVGILNFIGLTLLKIPFALPLALLAGILEIIPNLGPIVAAIPAVIIGFSISPLTGFAVISLAFLIQQTENYFLVPKILEKSVGVSPIITLLALATGFKLAGIVGVLISVPILITFQVLIKKHLSVK